MRKLTADNATLAELVTKRDGITDALAGLKVELADRRRRAAAYNDFTPPEEMRALEDRRRGLVASLHQVERELARVRERERAARGVEEERGSAGARVARAFMRIAERRLTAELFGAIREDAEAVASAEREGDAQGATS